MFAWIEVFALVSCVWTASAGPEDINQRVTTNTGTKLLKISTELSPDGNLLTRCFILTTAAAPRQPPGPPNETCPPGTTPTLVCGSEFLFEAPRGAGNNFSVIQEEAKNYFVLYDREKSLSKAQVTEIILSVMLSGVERLADGIKALKARLKSGGLGQETAGSSLLCLPDDLREEKVVNDCLADETVDSAAESPTPATANISTPRQEQHKRTKGDLRQGVKSLIDLLKSSTIPDNKGPQIVTKTPSNRAPERISSPSAAASVVVPDATPPGMDTQTTQLKTASSARPASANASPGAPSPSLQLSLSGVITAALPVSISKLTALLSLSFAPVPGAPSETNKTNHSIFPAAKNTSESPSSLAPTNSISQKTPRMTFHTAGNSEPLPTQTLLSGTTLSSTAATITTNVPEPPLNSTISPVQSASQSLPATSATADTVPHFPAPSQIAASKPSSPTTTAATVTPQFSPESSGMPATSQPQ